MTALIVIAAILLLLALLRFGVSAQYDGEGLIVSAFAGFVKFRVFPQKEGAKIVKEKAAKAVKKAEEIEKAKTTGSVETFKEFFPMISKFLGRLRRRLLVNELTVHYVSAGRDPAKAALVFGYSNAAFGIIIPMLENTFRIKKRDLTASVDFDSAEPKIFFRASLSIAVWEIVYILAGLDIKKLIKIIKNYKKSGKVEVSNG